MHITHNAPIGSNEMECLCSTSIDYHTYGIYAIATMNKKGVDNLPFSENLKKLKDDKAISNYRMAKDLGIHSTTVQNWLDGKSPTFAHLQLVANYFCVTVNELISDSCIK